MNDSPRRGRGSTLWLAASAAIAALVLLPIAALAAAGARGSAGLWQHAIVYVLPAAALDTLLVLAGVGALCAAIGTGTAWLVTAYDFPGRRTLAWALLLPLAVPTYIVAYAYLDVLHPVGPVQEGLRALLGFDSPRDFRLPDVRSMTGCILLLGFVLYPYVYLTTRAMFQMQSANVIDAARTLGVGRRSVFPRVALPLARPAVAVGLSLALMEALNDVGASEFLGVRTMTVAIYTTWITRSDLPGAAQMALAMLALVVGLVLLERRARRERGYASEAQHPRPLARHRLRGPAALVALGCGALPVVIGFGVPAAYLVSAAASRARMSGVPPAILEEAWITVALSALATGIALVFAVVVTYAVRLDRGHWAAFSARAASVGYAVPGTVLAIGLLPVVAGFDTIVDRVARLVTGAGPGLLLLGSGGALIYAYVARFLTIAAGGVEAGFSRIPRTIDDAARTLGTPTAGRLRRIHLPLVRPAIASSALLVFVDCMKELPATLLLRPIGVETLATHLYGDAVRGTYEDAAIAALLIVVAGLLPVVMMARIGERDYKPRPPFAVLKARGAGGDGAAHNPA
jgi:iron(III) transport system permease protein